MPDNFPPSPDKAGKGKKGRKGASYENHEGEDRYARMAREAEEYSREKVLADARAAVEEASRESSGRRKKRKEKRAAEAAAAAEERKIEEALAQGINPEDLDAVKVSEGVTVAELAEILEVSANDIIKRLFLLGTPLTMTQTMSNDLVELVADDLGRQVRIVTAEEENSFSFYDAPEDLKSRPPVVTVMGHVDHGKTSLLDAIRHTNVWSGEAGGITQHIGASEVTINGRQITFVDTPGHEAFTAMRARGAKITDVVVLVVAADDGVMPQTIEAINHSKAAGVPIIVAVNKCDKPEANPDKVRQMLTEYGIIPEEWGGQNMFVNVSAKKGQGIDDLLETILLQADVLELKANPDTFASGNIIERSSTAAAARSPRCSSPAAPYTWATPSWPVRATAPSAPCSTSTATTRTRLVLPTPSRSWASTPSRQPVTSSASSRTPVTPATSPSSAPSRPASRSRTRSSTSRSRPCSTR